MSYTVYGLRVRGEHEPRYIGRSQCPADKRLRDHFRCAVGEFGKWLANNRDSIEVFRIAEADNIETAKAAEKLAIVFADALGHRLFNRMYLEHRKHAA